MKISLILFCVIFLAALVVIAPRLFLCADRVQARNNCRSLPSVAVTLSENRSQQPATTTVRPFHGDQLSEYAHCLDAVARLIRSHISARDALTEALSHLTPTPFITGFLEWLQQEKDITTGLNHSLPHTDEGKFFLLLRRSYAYESFVPQALEQSASYLREEAAHRRDVITATAQARSSARLLTLLPFGVLTVLLLVSATARHNITSLSILCILFVGIVINRTGWHWVQRLVKSASSPVPTISQQLAEEISVALRAGYSIRQALENWASNEDPLLFQQLSIGAPLAASLQEFATRHDSNAFQLSQLLIDAERDGLPIIDTIHRLSSEMRQHRHHIAEVSIRQLPTKLTLPLVLCILPSFIFLTVLPVVVTNLQHLQFVPSPTHVTS